MLTIDGVGRIVIGCAAELTSVDAWPRLFVLL